MFLAFVEQSSVLVMMRLQAKEQKNNNVMSLAHFDRETIRYVLVDRQQCEVEVEVEVERKMTPMTGDDQKGSSSSLEGVFG